MILYLRLKQNPYVGTHQRKHKLLIMKNMIVINRKSK